MVARYRKRTRRPARRLATLSPKRRLLVVCEGQCSEPDYLRGHHQHVRTSVVEIEIAAEHGEPKRVVEIAKRLRNEAAAKAERQGDAHLGYDEVWCVFDRDSHPRFDAACIMARDNNLEMAASNPCFELWLLLHFRENPGPQHRDRLKQMLGSYLPAYDKHIDFGLLAAGLDAATKRARRLDKEAQEQDEPGRNPTTGVYRLTESISRSHES